MIDDTSEPGAWADALGCPPWIEDRDGTAYRNLPAMRFKRRFDAGEGSNDAAPLAPVSTFHSTVTSPEVQHDHGA